MVKIMAMLVMYTLISNGIAAREEVKFVSQDECMVRSHVYNYVSAKRHIKSWFACENTTKYIDIRY